MGWRERWQCRVLFLALTCFIFFFSRFLL
jgi:hypothetical protein